MPRRVHRLVDDAHDHDRFYVQAIIKAGYFANCPYAASIILRYVSAAALSCARMLVEIKSRSESARSPNVTWINRARPAYFGRMSSIDRSLTPEASPSSIAACSLRSFSTCS